MRWLTSAVSPSAAATAVMPSSSGIPAATSAPKAKSRISSVTGSEVTSARWKSFWMRSLIAWLALRVAELADEELGMGSLNGGRRGQRGRDAILGGVRIAGDLERQQRRGAVLGAHALVAALQAATRSARRRGCGTGARRAHRRRRGTALPTADRCGSGTAPARPRARSGNSRPAPGWPPATRRSPVRLLERDRPDRRCRARRRQRRRRASSSTAALRCAALQRAARAANVVDGIGSTLGGAVRDGIRSRPQQAWGAPQPAGLA